MRKDTSSAIPVVMYHTVGRPIPEWEWSFLTVPYKIFESHLKWLVKAGYKTVDLYELHAHVSGKKQLPKRSVVLTFDDGYLDNWGYVAPLLSKYGLKGTVFINPEFVDPRDIIRPTIKDVWSGKLQEEDVPVRSFMSWPELKLLSDSGPLSIQSHGMSHTWYPSGSKIIDFHHPNDGIYWLDWNEYPEEKPLYLENLNKSKVAWGTPIYEHDKALAGSIFSPNHDLDKEIVSYVQKNGGNDFFANKNWRKELFCEVSKLKEEQVDIGCFEIEYDRDERYRYELTESKMIIEEKIGKPIDFFFWPGGGYNDRSQAIALELYTAITLRSSDTSQNRNRPKDDHRLIRRIAPRGIHFKGAYRYFGGRHFVLCLIEYEDGKLFSILRKISKFYEVIRAYCSCIFVNQNLI